MVAPGVEASGGPPADVGAASERAQARIRAGATMLDGGCRHVQDTCAGRVPAQAFLPLLLVAAMLERHVERPHPLEGAAADRHVGAPGKARVGVVGAELERGDRRRLAPAAVRRGSLQAGDDRPGEHVHVRVLAGGRQQRREPAGEGADVVVDEHHQLPAGALDAGVARDVQAERARVRLVAGAEALSQLARLL